jgi:hypothetical protein
MPFLFNMYTGALHARKAFDHVSHVELFKILIAIDLPGKLMDSCGKTSAVIQWNDILLQELSVVNNIRQGSIIKSMLINVYVATILMKLSKSDFGCHVSAEYVWFVANGDDLQASSHTP